MITKAAALLVFLGVSWKLCSGCNDNGLPVTGDHVARLSDSLDHEHLRADQEIIPFPSKATRKHHCLPPLGCTMPTVPNSCPSATCQFPARCVARMSVKQLCCSTHGILSGLQMAMALASFLSYCGMAWATLAATLIASELSESASKSCLVVSQSVYCVLCPPVQCQPCCAESTVC